MEKGPFFSIITPTYNRASFLPRAIGSVRSQQFQDFEHIIVDDGSTDDTEQLITELRATAPYMVYIKQENKGRSTARNVGIEAAKGKYICFLDSDDRWLPEHLQAIYEAVKDLEEPIFAFTALKYEFHDRTETKMFPEIGNSKPIDYVIGNNVSTITVAIPRTVLLTQRFNPTLSVNEDLELWARIVPACQILRIDHATAVAVQHMSNTRSVFSDYIKQEAKAMSLIFNNPKLKPYYSIAFRKRKQKSLREHSIRLQKNLGNRWKLVFELIIFLFKYPLNPHNRAKLVMLIYNLPGGSAIKHLVNRLK